MIILKNKRKRKLVALRHLINFVCYIFYKLRLTRHILMLFVCCSIYLPLNLVFRKELYNDMIYRKTLIIMLSFITLFIVLWDYMYNRGKLVCNRLSEFRLDGLGILMFYENFRRRYEYTRDLRLEEVRRSGYDKILWYSIEPCVDTNEIYWSILIRYYTYKFRYEFDKVILKLMLFISVVYALIVGKNINLFDYIFILIFCLVCAYCNLYVVKRLPLDYNNFKGSSFQDFELYELNRKLEKNKIDEITYNQYTLIEINSRRL